MFVSLFAPDTTEGPAIPSPHAYTRQDVYHSVTNEDLNQKQEPVLNLRDAPVFRSISVAALESAPSTFSEKRNLSVPEFWTEAPQSFLTKFNQRLAMLDDPVQTQLRHKYLEAFHRDVKSRDYSQVELLTHAMTIRRELLIRLTDRTWDNACKDWIYKIYCELDSIQMWKPQVFASIHPITNQIKYEFIADTIPEEYATILMKQYRAAEIVDIVLTQCERGQNVSWVRGIITEGQYLTIKAHAQSKNPSDRAILKDHLRIYREHLRMLIGAEKDDTLLVK